MKRDIRILTDFSKFPPAWRSCGCSGSAFAFTSLRQCIRQCRKADLIIINGNVSRILTLSALFVLCPFLRTPIIAVDLVLRKPEGRRALLISRVKRLLFGYVDHFVHYFRDLTGYQKYYGIGPERSSFVAFKANIYDTLEVLPAATGEYVLCIGRSLRDFDTFFSAVETLPYPATIPKPDFVQLRNHGARFSRSLNNLPSQVAVLDDDGSATSLTRLILGARIVVIPILRKSLCASGIGTYLNSMLLGKCVIISEGPGASDVLSNQALLVPPEDPIALAEAIQRAWEDQTLRTAIANSGRRFAESLGGERELMQRILDVAIPVLRTL